MNSPSSEPPRTCPACGQTLSPTAILCPACGVAVAESVWPPSPHRGGPGLLQTGPPIAGGIITSNIVAAVLISLNDWLVIRTAQSSPTLVASDFLLVPFVMGIVCAFFWRRLKFSTMQYFLFSLLTSGVAIAVSALFMGEGVICLMIVSPLIILLIFAGSLLGRVLFQWNNNRLNFSLIPLVLLVMGCDSLSKHEYHASVTDRVIIRASPTQVWTHLADIPSVPEAPDFWLFKMGLPYPVQATAPDPSVGAERLCVFSGNLVFQERITEAVPGQKLTFDIVHQPDHPEILDHALVKRGQFRLQDNHDGTTTLIGTSWYDLYVYPSWYYDLWARSIARAVHLRVMDHIKAECEAPNGRV